MNLRTAAAARASCLLVNAASSGGASAHLYGTQQLLPGDVRTLLRGFVLNRCSGDLAHFVLDAARLQALTGVPTLAVLPMWHGHGLPEEDGVFDEAPSKSGAGLRIAVVAYPRISNLDEFQPLKNLSGVQLCWARSPGDLKGADWIVLPGSKHTSSDLAWLRAQGLDRAVAAHAARGGAVLGICGGLQMLGAALIDPHGIDGNAPGLGLLALSTTYQQHKTVRHRQVKFDAFDGSAGPWNALSGVTLRGYEIHHGETIAASVSDDHVTPVIGDGLGWRNSPGNVLGIYLHGLFEEPAVLHALFGAGVPTLDTVFDGLADCIDRHFAPGALPGLLR